MRNPELSRREFISDAGKKMIAAALLTPLIGFSARGMSKSAPISMESVILDTAKPEYASLARIGGAIKIPDPRKKKGTIIVSRISQTEVAAFSSKCTHFGCEVPLPQNNVITCPCHKSGFDASGKVIHGPAKKDLYAFSAEITKSIIIIKEKSA
jgi:Rieske Fe-S protein